MAMLLLSATLESPFAWIRFLQMPPLMASSVYLYTVPVLLVVSYLLVLLVLPVLPVLSLVFPYLYRPAIASPCTPLRGTWMRRCRAEQ